jgi:hypothetical protein
MVWSCASSNLSADTRLAGQAAAVLGSTAPAYQPAQLNTASALLARALPELCTDTEPNRGSVPRALSVPTPAAPTGLPEKLGTAPLRLIIVGHNPSAHAWQSGHYYSNPANRMWGILRATGIAPASSIRGSVDDDRMPAEFGVGFTDVGTGVPGTNSAKFTSANFVLWRRSFYARCEPRLMPRALPHLRVSYPCACQCCSVLTLHRM